SSYSRGVRIAIKRAPLVIIMLICIYVGTVGLFSAKSSGFIPGEDAGIFMMGVTLPEGASSVRTDEVIDEITAYVNEEVPELKNITSINGINLLNRSFKSNAATFFLQLKPWEARNRTVEQVLQQVQGKFTGYKKASVLAVSPPAIPGLGSSGGFSMQLQDQKGGDIKAFEAVAQRFVAAANSRPEIGMAYTLFNTQTPNYEITIDRDQAKKMGVSVGS